MSVVERRRKEQSILISFEEANPQKVTQEKDAINDFQSSPD